MVTGSAGAGAGPDVADAPGDGAIEPVKNGTDLESTEPAGEPSEAAGKVADVSICAFAALPVSGGLATAGSVAVTSTRVVRFQ